MNAINTTLTTSGNSVAVRLPKELLKMSGLGSRVKLEAKKGTIIISKVDNPHKDWEEQIAQVIANNPDVLKTDPELEDWNSTSNDGLGDEL